MSKLGELSDEALMAAYVDGDRRAFSELFRRYSPRLMRMMRRDLARADEAHDLVQQTMLQVHRARRDFQPDRKLRPWLYTIALNLKRQHFRRVGRKPETSYTEGTHPEPVASDNPEATLADAQLRQALHTLPEGQRVVIELHWFEGLTFKEVAQVVGATPSAVKVRAHRGYTKLRSTLAEDGVTDIAGAAYASEQR